MTMDTMKGIVALQLAETVTKAGGSFSISFFPFSRSKPATGNAELKTYRNCTMRKPLPHEKWDIDGKNFCQFLRTESPRRATGP